MKKKVRKETWKVVGFKGNQTKAVLEGAYFRVNSEQEARDKTEELQVLGKGPVIIRRGYVAKAVDADDNVLLVFRRLKDDPEKGRYYFRLKENDREYWRSFLDRYVSYTQEPEDKDPFGGTVRITKDRLEACGPKICDTYRWYAECNQKIANGQASKWAMKKRKKKAERKPRAESGYFVWERPKRVIKEYTGKKFFMKKHEVHPYIVPKDFKNKDLVEKIKKALEKCHYNLLRKLLVQEDAKALWTVRIKRGFAKAPFMAIFKSVEMLDPTHKEVILLTDHGPAWIRGYKGEVTESIERRFR